MYEIYFAQNNKNRYENVENNKQVKIINNTESTIK